MYQLADDGIDIDCNTIFKFSSIETVTQLDEISQILLDELHCEIDQIFLLVNISSTLKHLSKTVDEFVT